MPADPSLTVGGVYFFFLLSCPVSGFFVQKLLSPGGKFPAYKDFSLCGHLPSQLVFPGKVAILRCDACHRQDGPYSRKKKLFFITCSSQSRTEVRACVRLFSFRNRLAVFARCVRSRVQACAGSAGTGVRHTFTFNQ